MSKHYHNYDIIKTTPEVTIERCITYSCGKKLVTKKDKDERIDNKKFLKEHVRDFAQPGGRTGKIYNEIYKKYD